MSVRFEVDEYRDSQQPGRFRTPPATPLSPHMQTPAPEQAAWGKAGIADGIEQPEDADGSSLLFP
jgi:hypothetical protein